MELARRLLEKFHRSYITLTGAPDEAETIGGVSEEIGSPRCFSLAGKTTLPQLLVLYTLSELLITNDSGPAHFASMTPITVITLFGPETPLLFRALTPRAIPIWMQLPCSPCVNAYNNRQSPCRDNVCMKSITVDHVFNVACKAIWTGKRKRTGRVCKPEDMTALISSRYARWAAAILVVGTIFRLWYSTHLELVGDEAYYWLWSRHPDFCYLDKGPVIAWFISAGTALFGQTVFGIRFFATLLALGTGAGIFLLGRRLFSDRVAFWAVVLAALTPLFAVGATLMTIDTVYIFFWTFAALTFWQAKDETRLSWWVLTGVLVGLSVLSKYTGAIELLSFAGFCAWHPPSRQHFRRTTFPVMLLVVALFLVPVLVWNWQHGFPTSHFLVHRGALDERTRIRPLEVLSFLAQQAGVISPLLFLGLLAAVCWPRLARTPRVQTGYFWRFFCRSSCSI